MSFCESSPHLDALEDPIPSSSAALAAPWGELATHFGQEQAICTKLSPPSCYDPPQFFSSPSYTITPPAPMPPHPLATQLTVAPATQPVTPATPAVRPPSPMQVDPANVPLLPTAEDTPAHALQRLPSPPTIAIPHVKVQDL